jgi:hypothetical protein
MWMGDDNDGWHADLSPLTDAVAKGDHQRAAAFLREPSTRLASVVPEEWLRLNAAALEHGKYDELSAAFAQREFVGRSGYFLIVAPYAVRYAPGDLVGPAALFGRILEHVPLAGIANEIEAIQQAPLQQRLAPLLPVEVMIAAGAVQNVQFIVPDGWCWHDSALGPALIDVDILRTRFTEAGQQCIRTVFDADTADLLLEPLTRTTDGIHVHLRSYEIHDSGHIAGLGMARKLRDNLLPGYWYRGVEEWRADGIGFEVASRLLQHDEVASDAASNLCVRFGFNIPRAQRGLDGSTEHLPCCLILLDRLLRHGFLIIRRGRLALRDPSSRGLVEAFVPHRSEAIELTRRELTLAEPAGIMRLYGGFEVHRATEAILEGMIREPCRGFYDRVT